MANVFICHRKADAALAEKLANALRGAGHHIWFDDWMIGVGDSIVAEIDKGLAGTSYLVLCYSASGPSDWTDREFHSTLHRQLSGHPVKSCQRGSVVARRLPSWPTSNMPTWQPIGAKESPTC